MELDNTMLARILTSLTLGFHIIFAAMGVGIPVIISIAEWLGIRRKDPMYTLMARRWVKGFTVTVAVGVVTGTCIGLQLSLLWPSFMKVAGEAIALPLFLETFAFFFEAIFLGIYLYTWDRFKNPYIHWLFSIPVVIGSTASAFFIMTVNAFMNAPQGFTLANGAIVDVQPLTAMFNPATPTKAGHMILSSYATSAFILAAIAAWKLLKGNRHEYYRKALHFTVALALLFSFGTALYGDFAGKYLAKYQPAKLAAAEWHFETKPQAELIFGGVLDRETLEVKGAVKLPYALSILATGSPNGEVMGLDQIPRELWPPLVIHYFFDGMVAIGMYMLVVPLLYFAVRRWKKGNVPRPLLHAIFWGAPLSILAIELGWIFSEIGRQPWILVGYMKTQHAATTADNVGEMLVMFSLMYAFLAIVCSLVLKRMFKNKPIEAELK
ncbi:cytochrome ubiquinol oxidase subunit I [Brevibacillus borstelensis]|uniref:cytochrome ubiquinol oxidase subunit I n=1 Tax=Brevibacillus borstelensis TaxID=45462 RepID=UPI000F0811BB|nr:cytochrome ubiquinol oxidase subunit I [Brevibacillus borstelensis]MED1884329.1 cytochrome ubiquinol oxidase subunit I [Brevibacillus borstelensis]RNB63890.1 cytochrome ubiquinol oxidase subunit I [Brevibacillus borstelensis]GED52756.1 cytochrome ubiquinol oxidase subunit I [Brevibacillus borstelensis]